MLPKFDFCDELDSPTLGMIIDHNWYFINQLELNHWCAEHDVVLTTSGMFFVPNMETRTLMTLRWA